jgi:hypothetical protein
VPARLASGSYLGHPGKHMLVTSLSQADATGVALTSALCAFLMISPQFRNPPVP